VSDEEPYFRGTGLRRSFKSGDPGKPDAVVLHGVHLELRPREVVLLMGPSGSGKTTLLGLLSGLLSPGDGSRQQAESGAAGTVHVCGRNLWTMSDTERRQFRLEHFGFIFQGFNLFPGLTPREQLEMVLRWGKKTPAAAARKQALEWLDRLGIADCAEKLPVKLSGGEKQRVAIGRALIKEPAFVFADEPTSALDWTNGKNVLQFLCPKEKAKRRATVLLVAHDERIIQFADRVIHIEDGRLVETPTAAALTPSGVP
jgi:putative ABC transport system ATP-binding protein